MHQPHLLPKLRSKHYTDSIQGMPCTLRIAGLVGRRCADRATVVPAHIPTIGKGVATKVSDLFVVAACFECHLLLDWQDPNVSEMLFRTGPNHMTQAAIWRVVHALAETQSILLGADVIQVPRSEII
ncbi:MAG: hypothetical protein AAFR68_16635 [Pseudomonadota bacterium]